MTQTYTITAPLSSLCAECGCRCGGQPVTVEYDYDPIMRRNVATYRHASAEGCLRARAASEAFWYGKTEREERCNAVLSRQE